jgi:lysophospholipase L1-like esterase
MTSNLRAVRASCLLAVLFMPGLVLPAAQAQTTAKAESGLYVALGDSYVTGYQPRPVRANTSQGFVNQLPDIAAKRGYRLTAINFGCSGATTTSLLYHHGCAKHLRAIGAPAYPRRTQVAEAVRFIKAHRQDVKLITITISANDVQCGIVAPAKFRTCFDSTLARIGSNLATVVQRLRAAAGPAVRIAGMSYPDILLGGWVRSTGKAIARGSVEVFRNVLNPVLKRQFESVGGSFVDVTAATGAYTPFSQTTTLAPFGLIPTAVARVCQLTWYCKYGDIHPRTAGYRLIAELVAKELPLVTKP